MGSTATSVGARPDSERWPSGALSVSVAMATDKGAGFIKASLARIAAQTRTAVAVRRRRGGLRRMRHLAEPGDPEE